MNWFQNKGEVPQASISRDDGSMMEAINMPAGEGAMFLLERGQGGADSNETGSMARTLNDDGATKSKATKNKKKETGMAPALSAGATKAKATKNKKKETSMVVRTLNAGATKAKAPKNKNKVYKIPDVSQSRS
jgi:hypothetical protein